MKELYEKWTAEYFKNATDNYIRTVNSAWAYCSSIYDMRAKDIRSRHIKGCMEEGFRIETRGKKKGEKVYATPGTKSRIKSLFNNMLDYALEYEIVPMNYARTFELSGDVIVEIEKNKKSIFPLIIKKWIFYGKMLMMLNLQTGLSYNAIWDGDLKNLLLYA